MPGALSKVDGAGIAPWYSQPLATHSLDTYFNTHSVHDPLCSSMHLIKLIMHGDPGCATADICMHNYGIALCMQ